MNYGLMVKRLRRCPLKAESGVQFPLGLPRQSKVLCLAFCFHKKAMALTTCFSFFPKIFCFAKYFRDPYLFCKVLCLAFCFYKKAMALATCFSFFPKIFCFAKYFRDPYLFCKALLPCIIFYCIVSCMGN